MIDGFATQPHYLQHLQPVWHALPPERRGTIYVALNYAEIAEQADRLDLPIAPARPPHSPDPVLMAGGTDLPFHEQRPVVLLEHGAGQTYIGLDSAAYSGGVGRDAVRLFLCPNETVAARNRARYPDVDSVVVGAPTIYPRVLADPSLYRQRRVAFSFHWHFPTIPETRATWTHWRDAIELLAHNPCRSYEMIGHAHPKAHHDLAPWWHSLDVPYTPWWNEAAAADLYVTDNSSTLYEFAATDRPVVVLDAPWYRRDVDHGLRFWSHADVGVRISTPSDLPGGIALAFDDPEPVRVERRRIVADLFPWTGLTAARRAASAITDRW